MILLLNKLLKVIIWMKLGSPSLTKCLKINQSWNQPKIRNTLTVFNCEYLSEMICIFPMFFDLDEGILFNFCEMLQVLGFTGF